MNMQTNKIIPALIAAALLGGVSCGPNPSQHGQISAEARLVPMPKQAPPPPPMQNVPLDPQLILAADHELSEAASATDPIQRVHALEAFRDCGSRRHDAEILAAFNDPQAIVRFAAALAAGELKIAEAHKLLLAMADDRSENVRVAVRFALHRLGDTHLSHDLESLARDPSPLVRGNVAFVLGMLGEPSGIAILRVLRIDSEPAVRQQASEAMWRLGDEDGLKDLLGLTYSRYPDDQMEGFLGLALARNPVIRQHVRVGLMSEYEEVSLIAARAMGMLGSDEGYVMAAKGAQSSDSRQRVQAAFAFGAIGRSDTQDILRKLLADSDANVRLAAATAILQLKP